MFFFDNLTININSSYNKIIICNGVRLSGNIIMKISDNNKLFINKNTSIGGANFIIGESSSVFFAQINNFIHFNHLLSLKN